VGILYLVATPIGNLEDISQRALRVLGEATLIAAEDTRRTRKLLSHYQIKTPMLSYFEHSKLARMEEILSKLEHSNIALVSDAGTPGLSDPGYELVQAAIERGYEIDPIPGPSAVVTALIASGLPADEFVFGGYLPRKATQRRSRLQKLAGESRTSIFFESPHRLNAALADMEDVLGSERTIAICREMTKFNQEFIRGDLGAIRKSLENDSPRGEITIVVAGSNLETHWDEELVRNEVREALRSGQSPSQAAKSVAKQSGWLRQEVYKITQEER
jgi:16S rRNA (cytidine1402-2'-O)-methyltransferase